MIDIPIGSLVLYRKGIALFDIGHICIMNGDTIHIEIVHCDLYSRIRHILKYNYIAFKSKLKLFRCLGRLIVHALDVIRSSRLTGKISIVYFYCLLQSIGRRTGNCNSLRGMNFNVRIILQNILNRVSKLIRNDIIVENDNIICIRKRKGQFLGRLIRHMSGNCRCSLRNHGTFRILRIGYYLVRKYTIGRTLLIIMNGVSDGLLRPVSIQGNVLRHRLIPVIRRTGLIRGSEPSQEGVVLTGGIIRKFCIETVLIRLRINRRSSLRIKGHRTGWELERRVENKTCRHLRRVCVLVLVSIGMCLICIPSKPSCSFHRSIRDIAGKITIDIITKCDILGADQTSIIVIEGQRIIFCIVIKVETSIYRSISIFWPPSCMIFTKLCAPLIGEIAIGTISRPTSRCSIPSLRITFDLIPVIYIAKIVITHVD